MAGPFGTTRHSFSGIKLRNLLSALLGFACIGNAAEGEPVAYKLVETQSWARVIEGVPPATPGETVLEGTRVLSATAILEQSLGSLTTNLTGCLQAELTDSTLEFEAGSILDAMRNPNGPFAPPASTVGADSSEDNFGGQDHITGNLVKVAVRDGIVDILSGTVSAGGPVTDLHFGFVAGTLEYVAPLLSTGFLDLAATIPPGPNRSSGFLSGSLDEALIIPFLIEESYDLLNLGGSRLVMDGQIVASRVPVLQPGDANQDLRFDQFDIVTVLSAAKYRTSELATWGEGDWNGAPGGCVDYPPIGDRILDQFDIIAAQQTGNYLTGRYASLYADSSTPTSHATVPEPRSLMLFSLGLLALLAGERQRRPQGSRVLAQKTSRWSLSTGDRP